MKCRTIGMCTRCHRLTWSTNPSNRRCRGAFDATACPGIVRCRVTQRRQPVPDQVRDLGDDAGTVERRREQPHGLDGLGPARSGQSRTEPEEVLSWQSLEQLEAEVTMIMVVAARSRPAAVRTQLPRCALSRARSRSPSTCAISSSLTWWQMMKKCSAARRSVDAREVGPRG